MRYFSLILIACLFYSCGTKQLSEGCTSFHEGTFKLIAQDHSNTIIKRTKTKQVEKNYDSGNFVELDIHWINDCTYQLSNTRIIKGEEWLKGELTDTLTFEIIDIQKDILTVEASSNFTDFKVRTKMKKIK